MPNYPKEQLWELYKGLPEDLRKATFSEEVAKNIREICAKSGLIDEDLIFDIAKNVGYVFLGLLAPGDFKNVLEKELKMEKAKAEEIASEIKRFVFLPLKQSLEALYRSEIKSEGETKNEKAGKGEKPELPKKKNGKGDRYREVIE